MASDGHLSEDGTLLESSAPHENLQARDDPDEDDGDNPRGQRQGKETHASITGPDAHLIRNGKRNEAKLRCVANRLMDNRHGLVVRVDVQHALGSDERDSAPDLPTAAGARQGAALGADKGYDTQEFVATRSARGMRFAYRAQHVQGSAPCRATSGIPSQRKQCI